MGIVYGALTTIGILSAGTLITMFFEKSLLKISSEKGPAAKVKANLELQINHTDQWLYKSSPFIGAMGVLLGAVVIPFDKNFIGADLGIALFYFIVVVDFVVLGIAIGGWGMNTINGIEASYRIVAQLISYVVPLGLAIIGPIMMSRSLSTVRIIEEQSALWYIVSQPLGFALYIVTAAMQVYRQPFLEPFSSVIQNGILSGFGGLKVLFWRYALSGILFIVSAMGAVLFLGGYKGPFLPGFIWMSLKTFFIMWLIIFIGQKFKPIPVAKMLEFSWKILIPVGLLNVLIVGGLILLGVKGS